MVEQSQRRVPGVKMMVVLLVVLLVLFMVIGHGANSSAGHLYRQQKHDGHSDSHDGGLISLFFCLSPFFQLDVKSCGSRSFDHKDNVLPASLSREVYNLMKRKF